MKIILYTECVLIDFINIIFFAWSSFQNSMHVIDRLMTSDVIVPKRVANKSKKS